MFHTGALPTILMRRDLIAPGSIENPVSSDADSSSGDRNDASIDARRRRMARTVLPSTNIPSGSTRPKVQIRCHSIYPQQPHTRGSVPRRHPSLNWSGSGRHLPSPVAEGEISSHNRTSGRHNTELSSPASQPHRWGSRPTLFPPTRPLLSTVPSIHLFYCP